MGIKQIALVVSSLFLSAPAYAQLGMTQQAGAMVPSGTTNLPAGQYALTNLNSGQAYIVVVSPNGQMFAQDPRMLQISIGVNGQPLAGQPGLLPGSTQQNGIGGMIKQGIGSFLQNSLTPGSTAP